MDLKFIEPLYMGGLGAFLAALTYYLVARLKVLESKLDEKLSEQNCEECNLRLVTQQIGETLKKLEQLLLSHNHSDKGIVLRREI